MCMRSVMINHRQAYDLRICADYVLISESNVHKGWCVYNTTNPRFAQSSALLLQNNISIAFKVHDSHKTVKLD